LFRAFLVSLGLHQPLLSAADYFVDSSGGNDANSGTTSNAAWQSLSKVNATTFSPGDVIRFKAGGSWTGSLNPKGSGAPGNPIIIDQYGTGGKPLIDGNGVNGTGTTGGGAVYLFNQEYWEINNLEVINDAASDGERRGIHIAAANYGTVDHIHIKNCYVHNIRGRLSTTDGDLIAKRTGGIIVETITDSSTPTRFNDVLIEGNTITTVRNQGIVAAGNRSGQSDYPLTPAWNTRRASNLIIRGNTISDVTKNALILRLADSTCLVEWNVCFNTATLDTGNTMFTAACDGVVFQFNEGYENHAGPLGDHDGSLYDADLRSTSITFQYSYSHDNAHGLFWNYPSASGPNSNIIVRYNISRNDRGNIFSFSGDSGGEATTYIYNNTIYLPPGSANLVCDARSGIHTYYMSNNVFYILGAGVAYDFGSNTRFFDYNTFYGLHPASEPPDAHKLTSDPLLVAPGTGGNGLASLAGYQLQAGSPCIDSGAGIAGNGGRDFFGNPVPFNTATDRGAHEFMGAAATNLPPGILTGPQNQSVQAGANVAFNVAATGTAPLAFQWRKNGGVILNETATSLALSAVTTNDAGGYDVIVTNAFGSVTSAVATLSVTLPADSSGGVVIAEIYNGGGKTGASYTRDYVVLKNTSGGIVNVANWSLQHLKAGVWQPPFVLPNINLPAGGYYLVEAYYDGGTANGATLTADATTPQSSAWNFSTGSGGAVALVNNANTLTGCTSTNIVDLFGWVSTAGNCYEGAGVSAAGSATQSNQRLANGCQDTDSNPDDFVLGTPTGHSSLTPVDPCGGCSAPLIVLEPAPVVVTEGVNASLFVSASGTSPAYQWRKNATLLAGATGSLLSFSPATTNDVGSYDVIVINACGSVTSGVATVTVTPAGTNAPDVNPADFINPRFANVTVTSGVKFADVINYQGVPTSLYLDVYEPTGDTAANRPVIVWVHGGGFRTGSSRSQGYIVTYSTEFAQRGYVCLAIDYRLRSGTDMPTQESELPAEQDAAADCNTAFQWIRSNAATYGINTNWMFVAGGSAGGRTACVFSFHEGPDTNVCAECTSAILTNGINTVPPVDWDRSGVIANADLWGSPEPVMRWYQLDTNDVPTVIIHGTADATIDYQNSLDLYAGLVNAGVTVELNPLVGYGHTPTSANSQIIPWVANFFAQEWTKKLAAVSPVTPPQLGNVGVTPGGMFQFSFTNAPGLGFTVMSATNLSLPLGNWSVAGVMSEAAPGQYEFSQVLSTNGPFTFFRVRQP
jgi:acetyl esterase/lipase